MAQDFHTELYVHKCLHKGHGLGILSKLNNQTELWIYTHRKLVSDFVLSEIPSVKHQYFTIHCNLNET